MPKIGERQLTTMVKISQDTYDKIHYVSLPGETKDETINRILTEWTASPENDYKGYTK